MYAPNAILLQCSYHTVVSGTHGRLIASVEEYYVCRGGSAEGAQGLCRMHVLWWVHLYTEGLQWSILHTSTTWTHLH